MSKCLAVASGRGGVGKSTVTACLGAFLSMDGFRTLILDADIGLRSQDALLGLEDRVVYDLIDLASGDCSLEQALLPCGLFPELYLLPAAQFSRAKKIDSKQLAKILLSLRPQFDYILIDCPAGVERGFRNVIGAGIDEVLLVCAPDDLSVRSAERVAQILFEKQLERPRLLINRVIPSLVKSREMMSAKTVSQVLDLPLLGEIPEDPVVQRAQLRHALPVSFRCESRGAFQRIASRLEGREIPFPDYGTGRLTRRASLFSGKLKEVSRLDDH